MLGSPTGLLTPLLWGTAVRITADQHLWLPGKAHRVGWSFCHTGSRSREDVSQSGQTSSLLCPEQSWLMPVVPAWSLIAFLFTINSVIVWIINYVVPFNRPHFFLLCYPFILQESPRMATVISPIPHALLQCDLASPSQELELNYLPFEFGWACACFNK